MFSSFLYVIAVCVCVRVCVCARSVVGRTRQRFRWGRAPGEINLIKI
jgi:hypothetical protein